MIGSESSSNQISLVSQSVSQSVGRACEPTLDFPSFLPSTRSWRFRVPDGWKQEWACASGDPIGNQERGPGAATTAVMQLMTTGPGIVRAARIINCG